MIKVAVLIDVWLPFIGGGQKSVLENSKVLIKEKRAEFVIFHSFHPHIFVRLLWCVYIIPFFIFYHLFIKRFDIIDARAFLAGFPAKLISLILGIPVIYTVNGCGSLDGQRYGLTALIERYLLTGIKYSQQISDSQHFLKYPNINKNILVIPNGVDIRMFEKVKVRKNKLFTIIYVGRLAKIKGFIYLFKAASLIKNKKKDFIIKIVGQGEEETRLKEYITKNRLKRFVKLIGEKKGVNLIKNYKSSHLFALPSLAEGQPLTLLEAWAAKLPVIATSVGSIPYFVNPKNGWLVPPADHKKLSETILKIIHLPLSTLNNKGKNGWKMVKIKYCWRRSAKRYLNVYRKAIENNKKD